MDERNHRAISDRIDHGNTVTARLDIRASVQAKIFAKAVRHPLHADGRGAGKPVVTTRPGKPIAANARIGSSAFHTRWKPSFPCRSRSSGNGSSIEGRQQQHGVVGEEQLPFA